VSDQSLLPDPAVTEQDQAVAVAYTSTSTNAEVYDHLAALLERDFATTPSRSLIVSSSGDFGALDVVLQAGTGEAAVGATAVTLFTNGTFSGSLATTGQITIADGIDISNDVFEGQVNFTTAVDLTGGTFNGTVVYNDNANRTISYDAVTAQEVRNDGTGQITILLSHGATVATDGTNVTSVQAPTPSTFTLTATSGDAWKIYDDAGLEAASGTGSTVYSTANDDTGTWTVVLHRLGHVAEVFTWTADDGSSPSFTSDPTQILRPEGGPAYSGASTGGRTAFRTASGSVEVTVPNSAASPQHVGDVQQDFLHTPDGIDFIFQTGVVSAPTWGNLNGIQFFLSITGFQYDSVAGVTPESSVSALLVSSAAHSNVRTDNGGTVFAGASGLTAQDVWDYLESEATTSGSMKDALQTARDHARAANAQTQSAT
jgi:hypothetical protein